MGLIQKFHTAWQPGDLPRLSVEVVYQVRKNANKVSFSVFFLGGGGENKGGLKHIFQLC